MRKTKIFLINGLVLTLTALFMRSIGMLFNLYVSNKIGSEAVGVFSLVMSVYLLAITLATSGLSLACTRIVSEQLTQKNFYDALKAVKSCLLFACFLGIGSAILVLLFSPVISKIWLKGMVSATPLYLISIGLPFISISSVLNGYFAAVRKGYATAFSQVFELLIKILVSMTFLHFSTNLTVQTICIFLILADVISEIASCSLLIIFYQIDKLKICKRAVNTITFKKKILQITFPVLVTSCIRSGLSTLKQFLIPSRLVLFGLPYSLALSEYGKINGMALSVLLFPSVFINSFSGLLIPEFSSLMAKQYKKRIQEVCQKVFLATLLFSLSISLIFFFFANQISLLVFHNLECGTYLKILSCLLIFMYPDTIIDSMLKGLNKQFEVMVCNILDLILMIGVLYFLLPAFGLTGYLLAIIISEVFNFCVSFFQLHRATGFKMPAPMLCCYIFFLGLSLSTLWII